jgi:ribosomal RNA-processing protein 9
MKKINLQPKIDERVVHRTVVEECSTNAVNTIKTKRSLESITCVSLTEDDCTAYSGAKNGVITEWDIEKKKKTKTIKINDRKGDIGLLAVSISSDGLILATGGKGCKIHFYDTRSMQLITSLSGHKEPITGLAFRNSSYDLFSCSMDRSVNMWSIKEGTLVESLFGHRSSVLCLDCQTQGQPLSCSFDGSCRLWKVGERSQLVYKTQGTSIESCRFISNSQWVTGNQEGCICLWSTTKKKPISFYKLKNDHSEQKGTGSIQENSTGWVSSLATGNDTDLIAIGSGDGIIRFIDHCQGSSLSLIGSFPIRGFVNGLRLSKSGRFFVAGVGQEPRLGRWSIDNAARNEVVINPITLSSS